VDYASSFYAVLNNKGNVKLPPPGSWPARNFRYSNRNPATDLLIEVYTAGVGPNCYRKNFFTLYPAIRPAWFIKNEEIFIENCNIAVREWMKTVPYGQAPYDILNTGNNLTLSINKNVKLTSENGLIVVSSYNCDITCLDYCNIIADESCNISTRDHSRIFAGPDSRVKAGCNSVVFVGFGGEVRAGLGSHIGFSGIGGNYIFPIQPGVVEPDTYYKLDGDCKLQKVDPDE
jgi:hypothetical protein